MFCIQNTCDHRKFTLKYISHVLTNKVSFWHKFWPNKKEQEKKSTKQVPTAAIIAKNNVFLRTKKIHPSNRRTPTLVPQCLLGVPHHQVILHSEGCSQERQFPLALLLAERHGFTGLKRWIFEQLKGNGKIEFVWQKTKTNKTSPLPIERGWSPYLQVLQLRFFWLAGKKWGEHGSVPQVWFGNI